MKKIISFTVGVLALGIGTLAHGEDCPGTHWRKGPTCAQSGMDSHRGTCFPGDMYETLCDDAPGVIKTCPGPRRCQPDVAPVPPPPPPPPAFPPPPPPPHDPRRPPVPCDWDYLHNHPCPPGFINIDCAGACEPR